MANPPSVTSVSDPNGSDMRQLTDTLTRLIATLESSLGHVQGSQPRSQQSCSSLRSASRSSSRSASPTGVCWYHCRFGPNARNVAPLHPVRKWLGHPLMVTSATGCPISRLFFSKDLTSSLSFLVDTGAEVSVLPPSGSPPSRCTTGYSLHAANHSLIATYGTRSMTLNLGLRCVFHWIFIIAEVRHAILGADFLHHFGLSVDVRISRL